MSLVAMSKLGSVSALFNAEIAAIEGHAFSVPQIIDAITADVTRSIPVSKTAFFKHVAGNERFGDDDLKKVIEILKNGIGRSLERSPDASLSYSHAAIICSTELESRHR